MTQKQLKDALNAIKQRIDSLQRQLSHEESRANEVRRELAKVVFGIAPGVVVVHRGKRYWVDHLQFLDWVDDNHRPWVVGCPARKDGTFGTAKRNLFSDWEVECGK